MVFEAPEEKLDLERALGGLFELSSVKQQVKKVQHWVQVQRSRWAEIQKQGDVGSESGTSVTLGNSFRAEEGGRRSPKGSQCSVDARISAKSRALVQIGQSSRDEASRIGAVRGAAPGSQICAALHHRGQPFLTRAQA